MRRLFIALSLSATVLIATAAPAFAHASFDIKVVPIGATETFLLRVPVERDVDNERVEVLVPGGWIITACAGADGWSCSNEATSDGLDTVLTFTLDPGGDGATERFSVTMTAPADEGVYAFAALQLYADEVESAWIGEPGSDHPAPRIQVGDATTAVVRADTPVPHDTETETVTETETTEQPAPSEAAPAPSPPAEDSVVPPSDAGADNGDADRSGPLILVALGVLVAVALSIVQRRRRPTGQ